MNKPQNPTIDLTWFDLNKYDQFKDMTKVEWLDQLSARKIIINFLTKISKKKKPLWDEKYKAAFMLEKITNNPVIDTNNQIYTIERPWRYQRIFQSLRNWDSNLSIRQITLDEAITIVRGVDKNKVDIVNKFYDYLWSDRKQQVPDPSFNDLDWMEQPVDSMRDDILPSLSLLIDLNTSDDLLLDQFAAQLKIYRKQLSIPNPRTKVEKFNKVNLIRYGVIPYIDLQLIWGNYHGFDISERILSEMITATENAWTPENMRSSTMKWVKLVLSESFQDYLSKEAQIDHQENKVSQSKLAF